MASQIESLMPPLHHNRQMHHDHCCPDGMLMLESAGAYCDQAQIGTNANTVLSGH